MKQVVSDDECFKGPGVEAYECDKLGHGLSISENAA